MPTVNGMDQDALLAFKDEVADDSTRADRVADRGSPLGR